MFIYIEPATLIMSVTASPMRQTSVQIYGRVVPRRMLELMVQRNAAGGFRICFLLAILEMNLLAVRNVRTRRVYRLD